MSGRQRVFVGQPFDHWIEPEAEWSARHSTNNKDRFVIELWQPNQSCLLARSMNMCRNKCLNDGGFDYFAILHADVCAEAGWLDVLIDEMQEWNADIIHAPAAVKSHHGLTTTAVAYDDDEWAVVRKITTTELQKLPETFDIETLNDCYDADAIRLLPNTGCILFRLDVLEAFPGFNVMDRNVLMDGKWLEETVPEDWNLGHWAARNGVKVIGTRKVVTEHYGKAPYPSNKPWGAPVDQHWLQSRQVAAI